MSCFGCCGRSARTQTADELSPRVPSSRTRPTHGQDLSTNMGGNSQPVHGASPSHALANGADGVVGGFIRSSSGAAGHDTHYPRGKSYKTTAAGVYVESKPDAPLSSLTDAPNSASRDFADQKKSRRDLKRNISRATGDMATHGTGTVRESLEDREPTDNNGLSRGQNFLKVEKWLRDASMHDLVIVTPGVITNIENDDTLPANEQCEPPTELDRLPPMMPVAQSQLTLQS